MKLKSTILACLAAILTTGVFAQQAVISGRIVLGAGWANEVYVSAIPDFNQMYTASDALIVGKTTLDTAGRFWLPFPARHGPALYRLHVIKKGDPASTLIIGGRDENHVFFICDTGGHVFINHLSSSQPLSQADVANTPANQALKHLFEIINDNDGRNGRQWAKNELINLADSSHSQLVSLLAISNTFGLDDWQKQRVAAILAKFDRSSPYGANIFEQYPPPHNNYWIITAATILLLAMVAVAIIFYKKQAVLKMYRSLSQREATIIKLIAEGRSNKEIAAELKVELSTVKSHVNNTYAKLNIKGRKGIRKYKAVLKKYGA